MIELHGVAMARSFLVVVSLGKPESMYSVDDDANVQYR
jgi:hypothetical protein